MKITIHDTQKDLLFSLSSVRKLVEGIVSFLEIVTDEIILHFVTKEKISLLHEEFFDDPTPTDCIAFPLDDISVLGEIFVCPKVALEYAHENGEDPMNETTLYVIHALLHLLGYKDKPANEREKMRSKEVKCRHYLQENNLVLCSI